MPKDYKNFDAYVTVDYNILFIFGYWSENDALHDLTLEPKLKVYGSILQKESNQLSELFLIYQTSMPHLSLSDSFCDKFYNGSGFFCDLTFFGDTDKIPTVVVTFLSNGKITGTEVDLDLYNFDSNSQPHIIGLFGGLKKIVLKSGNAIIKECYSDTDEIHVYSLDGNFNKTMHSDISDKSRFFCDISIMNNNTGLVIQEINKNNWTLLTIDFPQLMKGRNLVIISFK
jgi:hypothetical protein